MPGCWLGVSSAWPWRAAWSLASWTCERGGVAVLGDDIVSAILLVGFFVALGTLLSLRQPANPIGWLLTDRRAGLADERPGREPRPVRPPGHHHAHSSHVGRREHQRQQLDGRRVVLGGTAIAAVPRRSDAITRLAVGPRFMVVGTCVMFAASMVSAGPTPNPVDPAAPLPNPWGIDGFTDVTDRGPTCGRGRPAAHVPHRADRHRAAVPVGRWHRAPATPVGHSTGALLAVASMCIVFVGGLLATAPVAVGRALAQVPVGAIRCAGRRRHRLRSGVVHGGDPPVSAVRPRPDRQPHGELCGCHRPAGRHLRRRGDNGFPADTRRQFACRRQPRRWLSPRCSSRYAVACRTSWTAGSTAPATTPPARLKPSALDCAHRSTSTPCAPTCSRSPATRCSPPLPRCGFGRLMEPRHDSADRPARARARTHRRQAVAGGAALGGHAGPRRCRRRHPRGPSRSFTRHCVGCRTVAHAQRPRLRLGRTPHRGPSSREPDRLAVPGRRRAVRCPTPHRRARHVRPLRAARPRAPCGGVGLDQRTGFDCLARAHARSSCCCFRTGGSCRPDGDASRPLAVALPLLSALAWLVVPGEVGLIARHREPVRRRRQRRHQFVGREAVRDQHRGADLRLPDRRCRLDGGAVAGAPATSSEPS